MHTHIPADTLWTLYHVWLGQTVLLYGWWLLEEGTSRNVPIAGFEMILREDYKSRDEVEGLIFFPKYHFKPQDTGNIPWCSRQQSRHLLYCMATHCPHCLARLRHSSQKFTKLSIFFSGDFLLISCAQCNANPLYCAPQCNAYPLYCARIKSQCAARTVNIHVWSDSIASPVCHLFAWKNVWYRSMFLLRSSGEGNILKCLSITWLCLANRCLILD